MLNKVSGLARALYIILAIVTAFVALGAMDVALTLVVLGMIAGLTMPKERMVLAAATIIALPYIGTALGHIPAIGAQLTAFATNLQLGVAGALATALIIYLYHLVIEGVTGIVSTGTTARPATATAR